MLCPKKFVSDTLKIALSSGQGRKPRDCGGAFRGSERAAATPQRASQMALVVKNPQANAGDIRDVGLEDPLEESIATNSSILDWRIPWTEEPGRL